MPQMQVSEEQPDLPSGLSEQQAIDALQIDDLDELEGDAEQQPDKPTDQNPPSDKAEDDDEPSSDEDEEESEADQDPEDSEQEPLTLKSIADALEMTVDEFKDSLTVTRKVDGKEEEVTLAELQAGNQREADYTQKTMEHSEKVRQWEQMREAQEQQIAVQFQQADATVQMMHQQLTAEYNAENWAEMESIDPGQAALRRQKYQERFYQIQQAGENIAQQVQQKIDNRKQQWEAFVAQQSKRLPELISEWRNPDVAEREQREVTQYLIGQGIPSEQVYGIGQAEYLSVARKAMLFDRLQEKGEKAVKKVRKLPKLAKAGKSRPKQEVQANSRKDALKRFRKTGNLRDAADAIPDELVL